MASINVYDKDGLLGTVEQRGDTLIGSTPAMQRFADAALRRTTSPDEAFEDLTQFNNGYVWTKPAPTAS